MSTTGHSESYTYDAKGRLSQRTTVADTTYSTNYAYDSTTGLLDSLTYPTSTSGYRLKLKYGYQYGILSSVADFSAPSTVFWQATAVDARGNVLQDQLGNGLQTIRGFDSVTGRLDYIQAGPNGDGSRQNLEFSWNKVGSLTQRSDLNRSLTEDLFYDNLHRLDYTKLNGAQNLDVDYDAMGNIAYKNDVGAGSWTYHATKKHAVTTAGGNSFTYDANGNQITRNGNDVAWTSYNYPSRVENGTKYHDFFYDANRRRWKQVYYNGAASETTIFVGGVLEKHTAASITEYRHYIYVGNQPVALYTRPTSGSVTTQYFHLDHLGSVAEVSNTTGGIDVSENFDAFGQRRDSVDWSGPPSSGEQTAIAGVTQRGFTFHTSLEASSLVQMNGRIADGLTGRFLSADPYIANPDGTQFFNRYSYVNNDPLTYADPSGFWCEDPITGSICASVIDTLFNFFGSLFGHHSSPPPPPPGCWVNANQCYGKAGSSKLFDIVGDIIKLPGSHLEDRVWQDCRYCLSWEIDLEAVVNEAGEETRPYRKGDRIFRGKLPLFTDGTYVWIFDELVLEPHWEGDRERSTPLGPSQIFHVNFPAPMNIFGQSPWPYTSIYLLWYQYKLFGHVAVTYTVQEQYAGVDRIRMIGKTYGSLIEDSRDYIGSAPLGVYRLIFHELKVTGISAEIVPVGIDQIRSPISRDP